MPNENKLSELNTFLNDFVKLPEIIIKSMQNAYTDEDLKNSAKAYLVPLQEQFKGISDYLIEVASIDSAQKNIEANRLVKMASGIQLVNSANVVSKNLKSIFSRLSLNSIVKEIKKLIVFLLDMFKAPDWIYKILLIIDQILNAIFGWDLPDTMPELLSLSEQNYYKELAAHNTFIKSIKNEEREN